MAHLRKTARSIQRQVADQAASVWKRDWPSHLADAWNILCCLRLSGAFSIIMQTAEMSRCPPALAATAAGGPGGFVTKMKWYLQNGHDTITINAAEPQKPEGGI